MDTRRVKSANAVEHGTRQMTKALSGRDERCRNWMFSLTGVADEMHERFDLKVLQCRGETREVDVNDFERSAS
jgi:hypothetical protein